jgi:hypothetical protein
MARDPARRFSSCREFALALEQSFVTGGAPQTRGTRLAAGAVFLALAVGAALWFSRRDPAPASVPEPEALVDVRLLDAGAEPRRVLRYAMKPGMREEMVIGYTQEMALTWQGEAKPAMRYPLFRFGHELVTESVAPDGSVTVRWAVTSASVEPREGSMDLGHLSPGGKERLLEAYGDLRGRMRLDARGRLLSIDAEWPEGLSRNERYELEGLLWIVRALSSPLPREPVGKGAKWEVSERTEMMGMRLTHATTLEVRELEGDRLLLGAHTAQTAPEQLVTLPGGGDSAREVRLVMLHGRGKGVSEVDLAHLGPGRAEMDLTLDMEFGAPDAVAAREASPEETSTTYQMNLRVLTEIARR